MADLSIIILSYNTKEVTKRCIESLLSCINNSKSREIEIIVVDNASHDGSVEMLKNQPVTSLLLSKNIGFGKANNRALQLAKGRYILFLNSDVIHDRVNYDNLLRNMDLHPHVGALTVRMNLKSGSIDPASHRGFPTLWRSFCYFSRLEALFSRVPYLKKVFGGYHLLGNNLSQRHEVEAISGAYFLARGELIKGLKGFDEDFFMYGEDLDLCYRIKKENYRIVYEPKHSVTHLKYQSGIKNTNETISREIKRHFYQSMRIFYQKHYQSAHPEIVNRMVFAVINYMTNRI